MYCNCLHAAVSELKVKLVSIVGFIIITHVCAVTFNRDNERELAFMSVQYE